jgi:hypothetical protein
VVFIRGQEGECHKKGTNKTLEVQRREPARRGPRDGFRSRWYWKENVRLWVFAYVILRVEILLFPLFVASHGQYQFISSGLHLEASSWGGLS